MAQIVFKLADDAVALVVGAFCGHFGYEAQTAEGKDNPVTPGQFTSGKIVEYCRNVVKEYQAVQSRIKVDAEVTAQVDAIAVEVTLS